MNVYCVCNWPRPSPSLFPSYVFIYNAFLTPIWNAAALINTFPAAASTFYLQLHPHITSRQMLTTYSSFLHHLPSGGFRNRAINKQKLTYFQKYLFPCAFFFFFAKIKKNYLGKEMVQLTHFNLCLPTLYIKTSIALIWLPYISDGHWVHLQSPIHLLNTLRLHRYINIGLPIELIMLVRHGVNPCNDIFCSPRLC